MSRERRMNRQEEKKSRKMFRHHKNFLVSKQCAWETQKKGWEHKCLFLYTSTKRLGAFSLASLQKSINTINCQRLTLLQPETRACTKAATRVIALQTIFSSCSCIIVSRGQSSCSSPCACFRHEYPAPQVESCVFVFDTLRPAVECLVACPQMAKVACSGFTPQAR